MAAAPICELGEPALCDAEARRLWAAAQQSERAVALFDQACRGEVAAACFKAARAFYEGRRVGEDRNRAAELYARGCELGDGYSCNNGALMHLHAEGIARAPERARQLFERGCDRDVGRSCRFAAMLLPKDGAAVEDAAKLYERGCELDDAGACVELGVLYFRGKGVARDHDRAANLFARACSSDNGIACRNLGSMHASKGGEEQLGIAAVFMRKGCELRDEQACLSYGTMLLEGAGVKADVESAFAVLDASCRRGYSKSCKAQNEARRAVGAEQSRQP